jgi:hypothetical protein
LVLLSWFQHSLTDRFPNQVYFWNETHSALLPGSCGNEWHTCEYPVYFGNDTVISATTYHRLNFRQICEWQNTMWPPPPFPCQPQGSYNVGEHTFMFFRQDTALKRVYLYDQNANAEVLLYQFGLSAGDTLPPSFSNYLYPNVLVVRTDSIYLADGYHRRMILNVNDMMQDSAAIIEGIGSTFGLLAPFVTAFENDDRLLCFSSMTQTLYPDTNTFCDIALAIHSPEVLDVSVYPNPFTDHVDIQLGSGMKSGIATIHAG